MEKIFNMTEEDFKKGLSETMEKFRNSDVFSNAITKFSDTIFNVYFEGFLEGVKLQKK